MDKQGSVKKIQKVQRAGVSRAAGQRRELGFPLAVVAIIVIGTLLTFMAREAYRGNVGDSPAINDEAGTGDYFHVAYGVYLCDHFVSPLADADADTNGIDSLPDGLIHIRPTVEDAAGEGAVLSKWADNIGLKLSDTSIELPANVDEETKKFSNGDNCTVDKKDVKSKWGLFVWPPQSGPTTKAEKYTSDFAGASLREDGSALVLAFVPEDWDACSNIREASDKKDPENCVPLPASMDALKNPQQIFPTTDSGSSGELGATATTSESGASGASGATETSVSTTEAPTTTAAATTTSAAASSTTAAN